MVYLSNSNESTECSPTRSRIDSDITPSHHYTDDQQIIYWFTTETKYGQLFIGLQHDSAHSHKAIQYSSAILDRVKAIDTGESLIRRLEEWLQCGLILKPTDNIPDYDYRITLSSLFSSTRNHPDKMILSISDSTLMSLPDPDTTFRKDVRIQTSMVPVDLILFEHTVDNQIINSITSGNILLIPNSFDSEWLVHIRSDFYIGRPINCVLNPDNRGLKLLSHDEAFKACKETDINRSDHQLTVKATNKINLPFGSLFGWNKDDPIILTQRLRSHGLDVLCNAEKIAKGHLISISSGYGIYIDSC